MNGPALGLMGFGECARVCFQPRFCSGAWKPPNARATATNRQQALHMIAQIMQQMRRQCANVAVLGVARASLGRAADTMKVDLVAAVIDVTHDFAEAARRGV